MTHGAAPVRVGLDLDGTIVLYDRLFHELAVDRLGMPHSVPATKHDVRGWVRALPDGGRRWTELQATVYGPLMAEAAPAPGVREFLAACRAAPAEVCVISHRTAVAAADPGVDLHAAALDWLDGSGLLDEARFGLRRERVFLEETRAAKLRRIGAETCRLFVDDLEEVLAEPAFPAATERWLYARGGAERPPAGVRVFSDWEEVGERVLELADEADGI